MQKGIFRKVSHHIIPVLLFHFLLIYTILYDFTNLLSYLLFYYLICQFLMVSQLLPIAESMSLFYFPFPIFVPFISIVL